ncbi:MAG: hypothetical protein ACXWYP_09780, partial [Pseudonocardia sp.]
MDLPEPVRTFLRAQRLGRLATCGPDGHPDLVTVAYQLQDATVLLGGPALLAAPAWGHLRDAAAVAFLVEDRHGAFPDVGVLLRGPAHRDPARAVPVAVLRPEECR